MGAHSQWMTLRAKVCRDGDVQAMPARELAPGDIILLASGDPVPADCRLLTCDNLRVQEADLTGESEPVDKIPDPSSRARMHASDRHSMALMGTRVVAGHGLAEVIATGEHTEWARIAALSQAVQRRRRPDYYAEVKQMLTILFLVVVGVLLVLSVLTAVLL